MIFPRGEAVHKNLSTAYTDLSALLATLKLEGFSGTIEIDFPLIRGILFIDSGEIINGEVKVEDDPQRIIGQEALQVLLDFSKQKEGVLSIYRLLPEQVVVVANNLSHEVLYKGLSSHFIRLEQLLLKLKEGKFEGSIEVMTKENHPMGVLYLEWGEPVEMFITPKSGPSVFGRMSIPTFIENAAKHGAIFNVYGRQEEILQGEEITEEIIKEDGIRSPMEQREEVPEIGGELKEILLLFERFLSNMERLVDILSSKGTFHKMFKKALTEKAEEFGFLDPFAGEFDYRDGSIRFSGEVGEKEFAKGLVESLRFTLSLIEKENPKEKLISLKLKAAIESFLEHHHETLKKLDIDKILCSLIE